MDYFMDRELTLLLRERSMKESFKMENFMDREL